MVQALNMVHKKWEGFGYDKEGAEKLVFTLKDPKDSCLVQHGLIRILVNGKPKISTTRNIHNNNYVEINGSFAERACNIMDSDGRAIAKVFIFVVVKVVEMLLIITEAENNNNTKYTDKNRERDGGNGGEQEGSLSSNSQSKRGSSFHLRCHRHTRLYPWRIHSLLIYLYSTYIYISNYVTENVL